MRPPARLASDSGVTREALSRCDRTDSPLGDASHDPATALPGQSPNPRGTAQTSGLRTPSGFPQREPRRLVASAWTYNRRVITRNRCNLRPARTHETTYRE